MLNLLVHRVTRRLNHKFLWKEKNVSVIVTILLLLLLIVVVVVVVVVAVVIVVEWPKSGKQYKSQSIQH
jgi:predicted PurR-regulated permease PerM